jgi:hypothetical protein
VISKELLEHRAKVCLFLLNNGLRSENEAVRLDWRRGVAVPELDCSVFPIPGAPSGYSSKRRSPSKSSMVRLL